MKHYFLFGYEAEASFEDGGIEKVKRDWSKDKIRVDPYCFDDEKDTPESLLGAYNGSDGFVKVTERQYKYFGGFAS